MFIRLATNDGLLGNKVPEKITKQFQKLKGFRLQRDADPIVCFQLVTS